eukprot:2496801-Amphidinium_carterae.2
MRSLPPGFDIINNEQQEQLVLTCIVWSNGLQGLWAFRLMQAQPQECILRLLVLQKNLNNSKEQDRVALQETC